MTTILPADVVCVVCGAKNTVTAIMSTNEFGSPDLDLRPPPMARDTLGLQIAQCRICGYCAPELSQPVDGVKTVMARADYAANLRDITYPELARRFRAWGMIAEASGNLIAAAYAYLKAAWACDDAKSFDAAISCRLTAARLFQYALENGATILEQPGAQYILLADVLRRAGQFDATTRLCDHALETTTGTLPPIAPMIRHLIAIERKLARQKDTACYTVQEALSRHPEAAM